MQSVIDKGKSYSTARQGTVFTLLILLFPLWIIICQAEPLWPHDESDLPSDPQAEFGTLDNGFRYIILPNQEPPQRVSLRLLVKAGSLMENDSQQGLAHFVEHMAFNGTENFEPDEMVAYFQRLGMAFGPDTNAHTSFHETVYYLELPEASSELLNDGLLLLRDYAGRMLFPEPQLERERGVILEEKRQRETADYRTFVSEMQFIAPNSLIPQRFPIGTEKVIKEATREEFIDFYEKWYIPERMVLVAVGEIDPEELEPMIEEYFADLEKTPDPPAAPDLGEVKKRGVEARVHRESEATEIRVSIQTAKPTTPSPDNTEKRTEEIILELANQILSRRFELLSREEDAPFNRGAAYSHEWFDLFRNSVAVMTTGAENWQRTLELLEKELRRALTHGFTESELAEAKVRLLNRYERAVRRRDTRNSRQLSSSIVRTTSRSQVWTAPETDLKLARQVLKTLDPDKILEALRQVWPENERLVFVSGNLPEDVSEKKIYRTLAASLLTAVEPPEELDDAAFAYTDFGEPGEIRSRYEYDDLGITKVVFANNAAMLIKPTEFESDTIHLGIRFGSGLLSLPEEYPGLALLAPSVFIEGGLEAHSKGQLERIFAGRDIDVSFTAGHDAFTLKGSTSARDLKDQLRLMTAYLQEPGYRPEALRLAAGEFDRLYVRLRHTVQGVLQDRVEHFISGGDPRFGYPARKEVDKLGMNEVREWLQPALESGFLTIAVVGDVSAEEAINLGKKTIGALPEREKEKPGHPDRRQLEFPSEEEFREFTYTTEIPRAAALVYWPTDDTWNIERTRRLGFLADAISDRLRIKVREEMGKAYSPFALHRASDTYEGFGYLLAMVQCDKEQAEEIAEIVREIGQELAEEGIDEDEHQRILAPTLARLREWVRNNQYWLNQVLMPAREYPVRLDWARSMQEDIAAIDKKEINQLAKKYLQEEKSLRVLIIPEQARPPAR